MVPGVVRKIVCIICFLFLIALVGLHLCGCAGDCIKFGGTFQGATGEIEYCFNEIRTGKLGLPVLTDDNGDDIFGFDDGLISDILDIINPSTKAIKEKDSIVELLEILKKRKETETR